FLHVRTGARETIGMDRSPAMLASAATFAGEGLRFEAGDIESWPIPEGIDLVFSNAALHWIRDHQALFARIAASLGRGGQLAVQMPANDDFVTHEVARAIASEPPFAERLADRAPRAAVLGEETYALFLDRLGFVEQHVRAQVYAHLLAS